MPSDAAQVPFKCSSAALQLCSSIKKKPRITFFPQCSVEKSVVINRQPAPTPFLRQKRFPSISPHQISAQPRNHGAVNDWLCHTPFSRCHEAPILLEIPLSHRGFGRHWPSADMQLPRPNESHLAPARRRANERPVFPPCVLRSTTLSSSNLKSPARRQIQA